MRSIVPASRSWTKTSTQRWCRPATRFVACVGTRRTDRRPRSSRRRCRRRLAPRRSRRSRARSCRPADRGRRRRHARSCRPGRGSWRRLERDEAAVGGDRRVRAAAVRLRPAGPTLTRSVVAACRSRTNTSRLPLVSPGTRFEARRRRPRSDRRAEIAALAVPLPLAAAGDAHALGRAGQAVADEDVLAPLVSPGTRFVAMARRPRSARRRRSRGAAPSSACSPRSTLTRSVAPQAVADEDVDREFVSSGTRFVASEGHVPAVGGNRRSRRPRSRPGTRR